MAHMANYAHYHKGAVAHVRHPQALPDRVLSGEGALRQDVINDDDGLAAHAIAVLEESAAAQRYAHHRQVLRRYARCQRHGLLIRRGHVGTRPIADLIVALPHRDGIDGCNGLHSWYTTCAVQNILPGGTDPRS